MAARYIVEEHLKGKEVLKLIAAKGPLEEWLAQKIMRQVTAPEAPPG